MSNISKEFAEALVKVQGSIEGARKDSLNPHLKNKYADLASCWEACRDALQANGVAVLQWPETMVHQGVVSLCITTMIVYGPTGETLERSFNVPVKDPTNPQALGSSITYGRRYGLCSVIGICPEDDDGHAASQAPRGRPKADTPKESDEPDSLTKKYIVNWAKSSDTNDRKMLYKNLKASEASEPHKTQLLTKWAEQISKELKEQDTKSNG